MVKTQKVYTKGAHAVDCYIKGGLSAEDAL